jgi:hypothetical protein
MTRTRACYCVDNEWINKNRPKGLLHAPIITRNYYASLTSQVDMLEQVQDQLLSAIHQQSDAQKTNCISISLPTNHTDEDSTKWRERRSTNKGTHTGVLGGSIPSAISNTGATVSTIKPLDPSVPTGIQSTATFGRAFGEQATATTMNKFNHKVRKPAQSVHIVPQVQTSLLSTSKVVNADYITIYDQEEVNFYDMKRTKITISEEAVLKGGDAQQQDYGGCH